MRTKRGAVILGIVLLTCMLATANNAFATLIAETDAPVIFSYVNPWGAEVNLAEVSIEVYQESYAGGAYSGQIQVDLGADDFLYVYAIKNVDYSTPLSTVATFSIAKTTDSIVDTSRAGSLSGDATIFRAYESNILVGGLSIEPDELEVIYFVSNHLPSWQDSYLAGTWASPHMDVLSPNRLPDNGSPVPEPATLLLIGSGLMGLAGWRKIRRKA